MKLKAEVSMCYQGVAHSFTSSAALLAVKFNLIMFNFWKFELTLEILLNRRIVNKSMRQTWVLNASFKQLQTFHQLKFVSFLVMIRS